MDWLFTLFQLFGGVAVFMFGMNIMSSGLEKVSGSKLERALEKISGNKIKGVTLGIGVTALLQSSTATTVMLVGFVNAGMLSLSQATNVIMGANIGTTLTGWITALSGVGGDIFILQLCKPANFAPLIAVVGICLHLLGKGRKRDIGDTLLGFSLLMMGMVQMSTSMAPLSQNPDFIQVLTIFSNPILGILVGAAVAFIIHSSAAGIGMLQALAATNGITYNIAVPIIMGQNIGTCLTALISGIGGNKNAKRTGMVHLYFNVIGSVLFIALYYALKAIFPTLFAFADLPLTTFGISIIHTIFNILATAVMLPLSNLLCKLATISVPDKKGDAEDETQLLDDRFLTSPPFAVEQCKKAIRQMSKIAEESLNESVSVLYKYDSKLADSIREKEDALDHYEDHLGTYLVKLSSKELADAENKEVSKILHSIGDFGRIGDHSLNILLGAEEMRDKGIAFSEQAQAELKILSDALLEIMQMTCKAYVENDLTLASRVEPLEQVIDDLKDSIKDRHILRLQEGQCTIELGFILSDLLTNYERISDHCSNLAACMIELHHTSLDTHTYLNAIKSSNQKEFQQDFEFYADKYLLPEFAVKAE